MIRKLKNRLDQWLLNRLIQKDPHQARHILFDVTGVDMGNLKGKTITIELMDDDE